MAFPPMPTQVRCPQCNTSYVVPLRSVIDVGAEPELKEEFLRGRVNMARCPQCGAGGILSAPILYHDPAKELLISYFPAELGLSSDQQEQYIGALVQAVMDSVSSEQRKGYFLQPRTSLTLEGLFDAVLEAEGISKEALEKQRAKMRLINQLLEVVDDEQALDGLVKDHRSDLTYDFFLILSDSIDAYEQDGNQDQVAKMTGLREKLLERVTPVMPGAAPQGASYDDLIEMLKKTEPGDPWRTAIALNRRRLDYGFFQALTARIESAESSGDAETTKTLTELRQRILDEIDAQNRLVREAEDQASLLIMQFSESEDLAADLREHREELDDVFFSVLARYRAASESRKDAARAQKLATIFDTALDVVEEDLPPDVRLINRLMRAAYPDGTSAVLEEHRGLLGDAFLQTYDRYTGRLTAGQEPELAEKIKNIRSQIVAKTTIARA